MSSRNYRCKIADLLVAVPDMGGKSSHYQDYISEFNSDPDIVIDSEQFHYYNYPDGTEESDIRYLECERLFSEALLPFFGFNLHASAVSMNNRAYLFSGPCGIGKSTHTDQWIKVFGDSAEIINDDKPPVRCINDKWFVFGSPWCGKDGIQINRKVPLAGICFLKQSGKNSIRRLASDEALGRLLSQVIHFFGETKELDLMLNILDRLIREIPVFELENYPGPECVKLSYETISAAAEEMGL